MQIADKLKLVYPPYAPLPCGATLWLEVAPDLPIIVSSFTSITKMKEMEELLAVAS